MTDLWRFALATWRLSDVEATCLQLQDDYQVSAALLLCGCWLGRKGYPLHPPLAKILSARAFEWEQQRLAPLRALRRAAGQHAPWAEWKRLLQDAELEAEHLLMTELEEAVSAQPRAEDAPVSENWLLLLVPDAATCEGQATLLARLWLAVQSGEAF